MRCILARILKVYNLKERKPLPDENIMHIKRTSEYNDVEFGCVELTWFELDENGHPNGNQIIHDIGVDLSNKNCRLAYLLNAKELSEDSEYVLMDDVYQLI